MTDQMTWGAFVPHGGAAEFAGWAAADAWARMRDAATEFDALGYDHLWVSDHLMESGADRGGIYFEAYSALAALSQATSRARLGALVTCALYRNAGMLAKQGAAIDVMSGGRFTLGLGGGWDEPEFNAFGYEFPSPRRRVGAFAETLEAVIKLWTEPVVDFDGHHVHLRGAKCAPKPIARPPIWTGTHGPRGLRVAARFADVANWNVNLEHFQRLSGVLDEACADVGRERATIGRSVYRLADLSGGDESLRAMLGALGAPEAAVDVIRRDHFVGEPEDVVPKVQAFVDAGARHIIVMCVDSAISSVSAERFLREVVPHVKLG